VTFIIFGRRVFIPFTSQKSARCLTGKTIDKAGQKKNKVIK